MTDDTHLPIQRCIAGCEIRELSDIELLAVIIGTGTRKIHVLELAARLFTSFGGLSGLYDAGVRELASVNGVGLSKSVRILSSLEAGKRIIHTGDKSALCDSPLAAWKAVLPEYSGVKREEFRVLVLDSKNRVIRNSCTSVGTVSEAIVHPREVFRDAIREAGSSVILVHNHPSGELSPSKEDVDVTNRIRDAGKIIGITLLDHIIVSNSGYFSMKEEGFI
ncbi:MAG TPA: DNA repair protein RadC [Spirochaetota bacterium]